MSRSDYKNIYEGYLDNTGYNNRRVAERYSFRERYGGCGSEPTPYTILSEPSVAGIYEGYNKTPTPQQQAQAEINNIYNNVLNYVNKFRKIATDYYNSGAKYYDGMNAGQEDNSKYSKYVVYKDITTAGSYCNLKDTVRSRYFMPKYGVKSEICCPANITFWGNCNFDQAWKANLDLALELFTFRVDVLKGEIITKYPTVVQTNLKYPTVKFTDTQNI